MRIILILRALGRICLGLVGCAMVASALAGVIRVFIDAPWWVGLSSLVYGLLGYLLAYGAFHHYPWEHDPRFIPPAA